MMIKGRIERRENEDRMVENLIKNGQLDLKERFNHRYMSNVARHHLDWSLGRLQKAVDRIIKKK